jgi:hypothetical protein
MKTLDHAFNADGLRKSGAKLEKATEICVNLRTWLVACQQTPNGCEQKQHGWCRACAREESAMARTALCSGDTTTGIQKRRNHSL